MSSLVRRLQIRALKRMGFLRTKFLLVKAEDGRVKPVRVHRGGLILNPEGEPIGLNHQGETIRTTWPRISRLAAA